MRFLSDDWRVSFSDRVSGLPPIPFVDGEAQEDIGSYAKVLAIFAGRW